MLGPQASIRHTAVNAIDATGRTQLSHACAKGDYELVKKLLQEPKIDIALEDESGMSPVEYAEKFKHFNCAALVRNEANYRANNPSNDFVTSLRAELTVADGADFDERLFRQAVQNDPVTAAKYLDQFVSSGRYDYAFTQLDAICGRKNVKSSALYSILNDSIVDDGGAKHDLLQHVVLQRVLDIKWELFGARKYYQQLLLYVLMIGAVLTTVTTEFRYRAVAIYYATDDDDEREAVQRARKLAVSFQLQLVLWFVALVFASFAFVHLRHLKPHKFTKLTRWMYDGKYVFDPAFAIPEAAVYKAKAKAWLLRRTILWTILVATPVVAYLAYDPFTDVGSVIFSVLVLTAFLGYWLIAFYFLHLEVQELLGEDPWLVQRRAEANLFGKLFWSIVIILYVPITPFLMSYRKYYASFTNKLQVLTYLCILGPFFLLQLARYVLILVGLNPDDELLAWANSAYLCLGAFIILSLWMLSLQYLEVNKTAGYLLPIVKDVMGDVWDFLIFYGVFQCGLTCAYYFIFQQKSDSYKTLWASFRATYFVMYGENGVGDFNAKDDDTKEHLLQGPIMHFGFILRMFHCAVMVVLLLNLLLAMMNKTVDRNWAKLQSRALASYARCVLRLETMLGHTEAAREKRLQILTPAGPVLNSIFDEHISQRQLTTSAAKDESDDNTQRQALLAKVHDLSIMNAQLETQIANATQRVDSQLHEVLAAITRAAK